MAGFVGRERELELLRREYERPGSSAVAVYGRRRIGKTTLVNHFMRDKPNLNMQIVGGTREATMDVIHSELNEFFGGEVGAVETPRDLVSVLSRIESGRKVVVFIDEFPLLVDLFPETPGVLQKYIDTILPEQDVMLIVCGSSIKAMSEHLEDSGRPLFGRFHPRMHIKAMSYREARRFHPGMSEEDRMRVYAIASGIPMYHARMQGDTAKDCIMGAFMGDGEFADEADDALTRGLDNWKGCRSIISAMACGASTVSEIAAATGLSVQTCENNLDNLVLSGYAECRVPWGQTRPRRYTVADGMQLFHHQVLQKRMAAVLRADRESGYRAIEPLVETFYGRRFEEICRQYLDGTSDAESIGSWAGKVPVKVHGRIQRTSDGRAVTEDVDVDIVARIREGPRVVIAFAECKFTAARCGVRELEELIHRSQYASGDSNRRYYVFSGSGFMPELEERAGAGTEEVVLVGMDDMTSWAEGRRGAPSPLSTMTHWTPPCS